MNIDKLVGLFDRFISRFTDNNNKQLAKPTSGNAKHSHDSYDGGVDGEEFGVRLLQRDAHHRQNNYNRMNYFLITLGIGTSVIR